ncbi:MAG: hypothetical protein ACOC8F_07035 [Planctomycetota bacterium]
MSRRARYAVRLVAAALPACLLAGCITHHPVAPAEMDRYWTLRADPVRPGEPDASPLYRPVISGVKLPGRWVIRREDSLLRSTISIVRALDRLDEGAEVIDMGVSGEHAAMLSDMLGETRSALESLRRLGSRTPGGYRQWARTLAHVLTQFERISRLSGSDARTAPDEQTAAGMSAQPLLEMLALYVNEQTGGTLLGDLGAGEVTELRRTLGHLTLRLGFAVAGRRLPGDLRDEVLARLADAERPYAAEDDLAELLLRRVRDAEPAAVDDMLAARVRSAIDAGAKGVAVFDGFIRQWDHVERIELALHRAPHGTDGEVPPVILAATVVVRQGRELRLAEVVPFQPVVAFRGTSRVAILPSARPTGEVVVSFTPGDDGGGVELRFEGLVYGLARLLVMPIADARIREVRVLGEPRQTGTGIIHATVLLEALGDRRDPRRLLVYQQVTDRDVVRRPFTVEYPRRSRLRTFSYLTPTRRYTYRSVSGDRPAWLAKENSAPGGAGG